MPFTSNTGKLIKKLKNILVNYFLKKGFFTGTKKIEILSKMYEMDKLANIL